MCALQGNWRPLLPLACIVMSRRVYLEVRCCSQLDTTCSGSSSRRAGQGMMTGCTLSPRSVAAAGDALWPHLRTAGRSNEPGNRTNAQCAAQHAMHNTLRLHAAPSCCASLGLLRCPSPPLAWGGAAPPPRYSEQPARLKQTSEEALRSMLHLLTSSMGWRGTSSSL